jgi:putative transposase
LNAISSLRESLGLEIAQAKETQVSRIDENFYTVRSQSGNGEYAVCKVNGEWTCQCPDHTYRHVVCKHIHAVTFSLSVRAEVAISRVIPELNVNACQYCGSNQIVRDGIRHNKHGDLQVYLCKSCGKHTTLNLGFKGMRATPQIITSAMQLYFTGESLRNVQKFLKLQGVEVSHVAVGKWIKKYVRLMNNYVEKIKPNVSDKWRADEIYMKIKGDQKYLFAMMDDETRFWIAQEVAETKERHDARALFFRAKRLMGKEPKILITDGLPSYSVACEQAFESTKHIRKITFDGKVHNNNKMERLNGEIRDREKTMRGLKKRRTPILTGYQLYHNYIRPHESLNGKTPSEACGIVIEGQNKWKTLIENASNQKSN